MVANIAADLEIAEDRINVKGKTNEKLGHIGREEGIATNCVVLIQRD
jgi:2-C-methyl-D-erythritol 2,4-cyclodiphosphate synthase